MIVAFLGVCIIFGEIWSQQRCLYIPLSLRKVMIHDVHSNLLSIQFDALKRIECESKTRTGTKIHLVAIKDTTRYIRFISTRNTVIFF